MLLHQSDPPKPGDLWYDTDSLELSIWYEDDDSGQWVPTAAQYSYDSDLETIRYDLATETRLREQALHDIHERLSNINVDLADAAEINELNGAISRLQLQINDKVDSADLIPFSLDASVTERLGRSKRHPVVQD